MAHPKRKHSHSRSAKKRTHWKIKPPALGKCTECKKAKPMHMVCPFCGYYGGKEVLVIEKKEKKNKNK